MPLASLLTFIPSLFKAGTDIYKSNKAVKIAKDERHHELQSLKLAAKIEGIRNGSESDMKMDEEANNRIAWGDDLTLILAIIPCVLCFYPPALPAMHAGFDQIGDLPPAYLYMLGMMLVSVWGYRRVVMPIATAVAKKYLGA